MIDVNTINKNKSQAPALVAAEVEEKNPSPQPAVRRWLAKLSLSFKRRETRTTLHRVSHFGPLRVQRPFYPEGDFCHVYILHPPGGIVAGDELAIQIYADEATEVLLTTPSAGKVYGSDKHRCPQKQVVKGTLAKDSYLEWFPQETIIFSGAEVKLETHFDLHADAKLCAWDFVCLGRRASGERFLSGNCTQLITITKNNKILMRERMHLQGGEKSLQAAWGLAGNVVVGTFYVTFSTTRQQLDDWRQALQDLKLEGEWGLSQKPELLVARYLGQSAEQGKKGFELLWQCIRPSLVGRSACRPRIWNT